MRRVTVLALGKLKESYLREAVAEYAKRLSRYTQFEVIELPEERLPSSPSAEEVAQGLAKEARLLEAKIPPQAKIICLCIEGKGLSSAELAATLAEMEQTASHLVFIIGSSHGLSPSVKQLSQVNLSLSAMTFPHQLARVLLVEQIYRAFSINQNGKYHK